MDAWKKGQKNSKFIKNSKTLDRVYKKNREKLCHLGDFFTTQEQQQKTHSSRAHKNNNNVTFDTVFSEEEGEESIAISAFWQY